MRRTPKDEVPAAPGGAFAEVIEASQRRLRPFAWPLFTAVWLLFCIDFVVQVLRTDPTPLRLISLLVSLAAFVAVFLWLMLRYPFPDIGLTARDLRSRAGLLLVLAALALYVELVYGGGIPYRFMYLVVAAAVTLPTRHAAWAVVAVAAFVAVLYASRAGWDEAATGVAPFLLIGIGMIAVSRLLITIRELRAAREEIARLAVAEERLRFARDLHDLLGHSLSLITLKSTLAGRLLPTAPEKAAKEIQEVEVVARDALHEVREAVAGYRRPTLEGELEGARQMLEAAGIVCGIENRAGVLPDGTDAVLAWTVREGTTNVIRHSRARRCEIRVRRDGARVHAEIDDDGRGVPPGHAGTAQGSGLSGLAERVEESGGDFAAESSPEGGFRLRVSLPLRNGAADAGPRP
jgi:two-component system, NarL family, sensor histidine kinase DesK